MNPDTKSRFDALETLRIAAWTSFDSRRAFEWKLALSLWTALAAFMGTLLTGRLVITGCTRLLAVIMVLILFALHVLFVRGVAAAHLADRRIVYFMRDEMMKVATLTFPEDLKRLLGDRGKTMSDILNWSYLPQLGVTGVFALGAILSLFQ